MSEKYEEELFEINYKIFDILRPFLYQQYGEYTEDDFKKGKCKKIKMGKYYHYYNTCPECGLKYFSAFEDKCYAHVGN